MKELRASASKNEFENLSSAFCNITRENLLEAEEYCRNTKPYFSHSEKYLRMRAAN